MSRNFSAIGMISAPTIICIRLSLMLVVVVLLTPPVAHAAPTTLLLSPASVGSAPYDFGKVNQGSTAPLLHQFFLKNDNADPVVVQRVQVSCGWLGFVRGAPTRNDGVVGEGGSFYSA